MEQRTSAPFELDKKVIFFGACLMTAFLVAVLVGRFGTPTDFEQFGIPVARGAFNQFTAILVTCIALVVPLTANLYSPRLVRLYVTHPLLVTGLSILLVCQLLLLVMVFFPKGTVVSEILVYTTSALYLGVLAGALPFLYGISQFLRPQFFMPMLTKNAARDLRQLEAGKHQAGRITTLFEGMDVITNIALTGMNRGDRQLVLLSLRSLHAIFHQILGSGRTEDSAWRQTEPHFVPGLAREGRDYLRREHIWPEAYVIAQMLKIMESANNRQQEILAELAAALLDTALQAFRLGQNSVLELHVMTFNTLVAESIREMNLRKFQNLSYYYRLLVGNFQTDTDRMLATTRHLIHYGRTAYRANMHFAYETVVYDIGELVLGIARDSETQALEIVNRLGLSLWRESLEQGGLSTKVGWRCIIRVYWEAQAAGFEEISRIVETSFLTDEAVHAQQINRVLVDNRELHTEFNDRLMRFAWISEPAAALAREFVVSTSGGD